MTNHIGFICEASYRLFYQSDTSLLPTILHALAYVCGKYYFTESSYSMLMRVLNSLVTYIEGSFASESSSCRPMFLGMVDVRSSSCIRCPFGVEANSVDVVTLLQLQKFDKTVNTKGILMYESLHFEDINHHNAYDGRFSTVSTKSIDTDVRFPVDQNSMSIVPLEKKSDATSNHTIKLLLLLELVANVVGWEFTQDKIVPQLLKIFKSCASDNTAAGVMVLIGQLGR